MELTPAVVEPNIVRIVFFFRGLEVGDFLVGDSPAAEGFAAFGLKSAGVKD